MIQFPVIDYRSHPAYSSESGVYEYDDAVIERCVRLIDVAFANFRSLARPTLADSKALTAEINAGIGGLIDHAADVEAPIVAREWLGSATRWAGAALEYESVRLALQDFRKDDSRLRGERLSQLDSLRNQGFYFAEVEAKDYGAVRELALRFSAELERRIRAHPEQRAVYSPSRVSPLGRAIHRLLAHAGVIDVLSSYKRTPMAIMGTGLEYSAPAQTWYAGLYSDIGLAESPLKYFHVDEADHLPKVMIYATPVGASNGPTGIIKGSNTWHRSEFLFRAHKGLDRLTIERYGRYVDGASYRAAARSPELRRIFMELPKAFQGSSHFGDDFLPDLPLTRQLADQEQLFLSTNDPKILVFDGARTLHRGALVQDGYRVAMQVATKNLNDRRIRAHLEGGGEAVKLLRKVTKLAKASFRG
jgi:hypothetical protein